MRNLLIGKFEAKDHPNFILVDNKYHINSEMYLQKETINAFINMNQAAKKDGVKLMIISGTRNFYQQKEIWEKKYIKYAKEGMSDIDIIKKIMIWSAMPATSRHHWGTDIDINGFDDYFDGINKQSNIEYKWLVNNASKFGFCQVYSEKTIGKREVGYNEEKWHWSYMPLSNEYLKKYQELISYEDITGFSASQYAKQLDIIIQYVCGVSQSCKNI